MFVVLAFRRGLLARRRPAFVRFRFGSAFQSGIRFVRPSRPYGGLVQFDQCTFGFKVCSDDQKFLGHIRKRTGLLLSIPGLSKLGRMCDKSRDHVRCWGL
jgi:hypothetical protein